ncbi:hypothetical protein [uncultured Actinomyces sp.]|uniref:hypothetical protein n=1 Tax=uncultured Actinomyces sp. TaxID=249061 RepID=UPI0028DC0794|nr:hypothetical protein [uncultured Actinomyces sp.]
MLLTLMGQTVDLDLSQLPLPVAQRLEDAWLPCATTASDRDPALAPFSVTVLPPSAAASARPHDLVLHTLERDVTYYVSQHLTRWLISKAAGDYLMLHAAGLRTPDGRVVGVIAPSGTGKTTFCSVLGNRFGYVTDETLVITPGTLDVIPYPKPLSVVGPEARRTKVDHSPSALGLEAVTSPTPLGALVLAERVRSGNTLVPMRLEEIMEPVIAQTSSLFALPSPLLTLAQALTLAGGPWRLNFSSQEECASLLAGLPACEAAPASFTHVPGAGDAHTALSGQDCGPLAEGDRFVRTTWTDAVVTEDAVVLLYGRLPVTLGGAGAVIWLACQEPTGMEVIHRAVVERLGGHPRARLLVEEALISLIVGGVIRLC